MKDIVNFGEIIGDEKKWRELPLGNSLIKRFLKLLDFKKILSGIFEIILNNYF